MSVCRARVGRGQTFRATPANKNGPHKVGRWGQHTLGVLLTERQGKSARDYFLPLPFLASAAGAASTGVSTTTTGGTTDTRTGLLF